MAKRYYVEDDNGGAEGIAGLIIGLLCVLFVLAPGVLVTSLLRLLIDLTVSQLWGCSIVANLALGAYMYFFTKNGFSIKRYLICAGISAAFIFILTLFINDNCFYDTVKAMLNMGEHG